MQKRHLWARPRSTCLTSIVHSSLDFSDRGASATRKVGDGDTVCQPMNKYNYSMP